ncbi:ABC transporter permease [Vibrio palustris]|uniref:Transport permease protein n=1 Tax=Vibrio palustris TaxID=1918946 RepID=A0A1R4B3P8_9VIBR|nr:ABC transporter permease [Vibrio palustris]SJL83540.1 Teichoic acid translocation permease protein TagG [Vibrio palustris]
MKFLSFLSSFYKNKNLIYQLTKRDILSRYRGSAIGLTWSIITPLLMLTLYTFVFSYVFKARWGEAPQLPKEMYALVLYTGMILHGLFSDCLNRSPTVLISNTSYIKKVVFPIEILNWVTLFSALFQAVISFVILFIATILIQGSLSYTSLLLPILLIPFLLLTLGVGWFVSALSVYFRDVIHLTGILTTILMFASPIFYPVSILPEKLRVFIYMNPLTYFIEEARNVIIWGKFINYNSYIIVLTLSILTAFLGYFFFQRVRKGFADVL